ncbi:cobalamin-independent methionine synthase II family protein [Kibdelosporangium phytohabitans]|uniref:5-methyltetrahydropteroyltriglutamate--homocysteine methyltransferase n=1 Tax=Kibdelosporangium phytohabitans TaxID=860235 RepID=A0A0N9I812_9PSEU|nr:cobalamin-independent methionine synthase II family protein [Kibdelosporangium phytohabitans]ALG10770.1 5-methyltetrahydropteroyltriglutamate--homocysteine methyltransferase [Kibdelosporangium phytohabitans]MBE1461928.1 5-methyltetrahydropteroyltriglutamate--homocysteine methyltransferase [Kibdelosporangium phytohabitans]
MPIPTEPIGSIPRPRYLLDALADFQAGRIDQRSLDASYDRAIAETVERFVEAGSPVIVDGEQSKPSFVGYPLQGLTALDPDGVVIPFADGHTRQLPRLSGGPFRYGVRAATYLNKAKTLTDRPVKQAVIAPSALSLLYPADGIDGYSRDAFIADLADEAEADIRACLDAGADSVQLDFTEGRLAIKLDPSKGVLRDFVALNNVVLDRFSDAERAKLGVHTCPGGDQDSVHSLDVDYAELLPELFRLHAGTFYVQLASEPDRARVLQLIAEHSTPRQRIFVGVTDPIDPRVETAEEVRDRVLEAARYIPPDRLGTCDDCGFSPFGDDTSTSRDTAFAKVAARVEGTRQASEQLGLS